MRKRVTNLYSRLPDQQRGIRPNKERLQEWKVQSLTPSEKKHFREDEHNSKEFQPYLGIYGIWGWGRRADVGVQRFRAKDSVF